MKIGLVSLGCPKNLVDGEVMLGYAQQAGHEITADARDADAIVEMAQHKRDGKAARLVVTGCLAERYRDELKKEIPEIDAVLGTGEVPQIVAALEGPRRLEVGGRRPESGGAVAPLTFHRSRRTSVI